MGIKRTIWRHEVPDTPKEIRMELPRAARVINFDYHPDGSLCLWEIHKVEDSNVLETRHFRVLGTGDAEEVWPDHYLGTAIKRPIAYVLHLFEV